MSSRVPKSKRFPKFYSTAFKACEDLMRHTATITSNSKIFNTTYSALIFELNHVTIKMTTNVIKAIKSQKENKESIIKETLLLSDELDELIALAYSTFHLRGQKVDFWAKLNEIARISLEEYLKKL